MSYPAPAQYQIITTSRDNFEECLKKMVAKGFYYSSKRLTNPEEIYNQFGYYPVITVGNTTECRMILGGRYRERLNVPTITVDDFLKDKFQAYHDA